MTVVAGVLCATCLWACGSTPTSPAPTPSPQPGPPPTSPASPVSTTLQRYQVSGRVTDEAGNRISGVRVAVHYYRYSGPSTTLSCPSTECVQNTLTNADGFFAFELDASENPWLRGAFGYVYTLRDGYESDVQTLPIGATPITRNLRISRVQTIAAGESTTVSVAADSALCWYADEDLFDVTRRCEIVRVTAATAGTLVVEARATGGGLAPSIFFGLQGNSAGVPTTTAPGVASVPVRPGTSFVLIGVPSGTAQKFDVFTSLR